MGRERYKMQDDCTEMMNKIEGERNTLVPERDTRFLDAALHLALTARWTRPGYDAQLPLGVLAVALLSFYIPQLALDTR